MLNEEKANMLIGNEKRHENRNSRKDPNGNFRVEKYNSRNLKNILMT